MSTVKDPTANNNSGFLWGIGVLLVIIAVVLGFIFYQNRGASVEGLKATPSRTSIWRCPLLITP